MRKATVVLAACVLVAAACGDSEAGTAPTTTSGPTGVASTSPAPSQSKPTTTISTCKRAPGDLAFEEIADGNVGEYGPGRYRVSQLIHATHFTIEDRWSISDLYTGEDLAGFSGLRPEVLADEAVADPFVEIWPVTSWCDVTTGNLVVFDPGELAAAIAADVRLTDLEVSEATVGSCAATRIDARVLEEYLEDPFYLGRARSRELDDIDRCSTGNVISPNGRAAEHVVFWAIDVDGVDLLINATYPPELADQFEPMLEKLIVSIEFE